MDKKEYNEDTDKKIVKIMKTWIRKRTIGNNDDRDEKGNIEDNDDNDTGEIKKVIQIMMIRIKTSIQIKTRTKRVIQMTMMIKIKT